MPFSSNALRLAEHVSELVLVKTMRVPTNTKSSAFHGETTHIDYHFTALAGSNLCEDLQDEGLGDIPGQIPHIPADKGHRWWDWVFVKQEVACKQRLV